MADDDEWLDGIQSCPCNTRTGKAGSIAIIKVVDARKSTLEIWPEYSVTSVAIKCNACGAQTPLCDDLNAAKTAWHFISGGRHMKEWYESGVLWPSYTVPQDEDVLILLYETDGPRPWKWVVGRRCNGSKVPTLTTDLGHIEARFAAGWCRLPKGKGRKE
ncbi:MAG TPA: hypothetical protein DDW89_00785 [Gammaproteobacteria bacterium]|nr:hypothetical protein [Gammaproteobacteria bacterium]